MKYRKKPVIIEAIQWGGTNLQEINNFVGDNLECEILDNAYGVAKCPVYVRVYIKTLEGNMECSWGDYIIKGIKGEFYPCKEDIFLETYDLIREEK